MRTKSKKIERPEYKVKRSQWRPEILVKKKAIKNSSRLATILFTLQYHFHSTIIRSSKMWRLRKTLHVTKLITVNI